MRKTMMIRIATCILLILCAATDLFAGFCSNDPVNNVDPLGLFDLETHANVTVSSMREIRAATALTDAQFYDLLRGAVEGSAYPDTQIRIPVPAGWSLPLLQDMRKIDEFVDYPTDQAQIGLKRIRRRIGDMEASAIGCVWPDYPRFYKGLRNWWAHGPSFLGPIFKWGAKHNSKVDSLHKTHFGELSWQHGMGDDSMSASEVQDKMITGSLFNYVTFKDYIGKGNYYDAGFELGKTLHYLQDTYTPSHTERDAGGRITAFYDYNVQSPALHDKADKPELGGHVYNTAAQQSQILIMMFLTGKTSDISGFFQLAPKVQIGKPGRFVTDKPIIGPINILKGNY